MLEVPRIEKNIRKREKGLYDQISHGGVVDASVCEYVCVCVFVCIILMENRWDLGGNWLPSQMQVQKDNLEL